MANAIYPLAKQEMLKGNLNMSSGTVKVALVDTGTYTYSASHQYLSSLTGIVGTPQTLGSKTFTAGLFDAADVTVPAVTGATAEALVIYIDTGTAGTSQLIAYIDSGVTNLPFQPNGGDCILAWSASGIFQL